MTVRLGEGIDWAQPAVNLPEVVVEPGPDPAMVAATRIEMAVASLVDEFRNLPRPEIVVDLPELAQMVNAVQGLKGNATADEIAEALANRLTPPPPAGDQGDIVAAIKELVDKIDFRLKGVGAAYGASGPSNISSDETRLLGHVTVDNFPATQNVATSYNRQKTITEFIPSSAAPTTIYKGFAANGTADASAAWTIQKFVFTGTTLIAETWTAVGSVAWTDRATATYT